MTTKEALEKIATAPDVKTVREIQHAWTWDFNDHPIDDTPEDAKIIITACIAREKELAQCA
jgi:hypothetical protein